MSQENPFAEVVQLPQVGGLKDVHVGYLIELLAEYGELQIDIVRQEFEQLFEKKITSDIVAQIARLYSDQIGKLAEDFNEKLKKNPLARREFRLRALWKLTKIAMKKEVRNMKEVSGVIWEDIREDGDLAYKCVMAAEKIMADSERFEWEKQATERRLFIEEVKTGIRKPGEKFPSTVRTKKSGQAEWMQPKKDDIGMGAVEP